MAEKRTITEFSFDGDALGIAEEWASEENYNRTEYLGEANVFRNGIGMAQAPQMMKITQEGNRTRIESWVYSPMFLRILNFFMLQPKEMGVRSGGARARLPRRSARHATNRLLEKLGQSPLPD